MASGLPTAWFRVSRGFFEFLSLPRDRGVGGGRVVVRCHLPLRCLQAPEHLRED